MARSMLKASVPTIFVALAFSGKYIDISSEQQEIPLRIVTGIIASYGLWEFIRRGFLTYMLMQTHFAFFDFSEPAPFFI